MPASDIPIDDDQILALIDVHKHPSGKPNATAIAKAIGRSESGVRTAMARIARQGRLGLSPVLPGMGITQTSTQTVDETGKKVWVQAKPVSDTKLEIEAGEKYVKRSVLTDGDLNQKLIWHQLAPDNQIDPATIFADLEARFADFTPAALPTTVPLIDFTDDVSTYPWGDPHCGLLTWRGDSGENWDLKLFRSTSISTFRRVISRTPQSRRALFVLGGDNTHADNNENVTPKGKNPVPTDGRHSKVFLSLCETTVEIVALLLKHHEEVEIIVLPGNHDPTTSPLVAFFLYAWFRLEPRVKVDISTTHHRFREYGNVMLLFSHGDKAKKSSMKKLMTDYEPEMWGRTKVRVAHTFHVHHDTVVEDGACVIESHQIMSPSSIFEYDHGWKGAQRTQKSITYDPVTGRSGRSVEPV